MGCMRRPVMFGAKADIARLILALMVVAECIAARFGRGLVKPALRENAPHRFDTQRSRTTSLVLHRSCNLKFSIAQMVLVTLTRDIVLVHAVMRQMTDRFLIAACAQLIHVVG